eukprot:GAHX01000674.1.p1 GENE.GAHX01000674.1~~GAHX01000674.1.p1  ORF type:complete len:430 (+),score=51.91 GAHX01000674.1:704-1993(+)
MTAYMEVSLTILLFTLGLSTHSTLSKHENQTRIAFGSCVRQFDEQLIWSAIIKYQPDMFINMGDVVYLTDNKVSYKNTEEIYKKQKDNSHYKEFLNYLTTNRKQMIAIWDDNDLGRNDGTKTFLDRFNFSLHFLSFLEPFEPQNSDRYQRILSGKRGLYTTRTLFSPDGTKTVKVIVLDLRSFNPGKCSAKQNCSLLGTRQWRWLVNEFKKNTADLTLIVSSIQFLAIKKFNYLWEGWEFFPLERQKMLKLIHKYFEDKNVIVLSGDVHYADVNKYECFWTSKEQNTCRSLYDITSSGLTHHVKTSITHSLMRSLNPFKTDQSFFGLNFGGLIIDWDTGFIISSIFDVNGTRMIKVDIIKKEDEVYKKGYEIEGPQNYPVLIIRKLGEIGARLEITQRGLPYYYFTLFCILFLIMFVLCAFKIIFIDYN